MTDTKPPSVEAMDFLEHVRPDTLEDWGRVLDAFAEQRATALDNPEWDATDAAHPAWWRGNDAGVAVTVQGLGDVLDGKDNGTGVVGYEPLETLRRRLGAVAEERERCAAIADAVRGSQIIRGRSYGECWREACREIADRIRALPRELT